MIVPEPQSVILVPRIFVSHSGKDNAFVVKLVKDLRNAFHNEDAVWCDLLGLRAGDDWWKAIQQQIMARYFFFLIMSPEAFQSPWVEKEYRIASRQEQRGRKRIIPLYYRDCDDNDIWPDVPLIQRIDFRGCDADPSIYLQALDKLLADLPYTGMESISKKTTNQQLVEWDALPTTSAQEEPEVVVEQLLPPVKEAFRLKRWTQVLDGARILIARVPGATPSELYKMQGVAALHQGKWPLSKEALDAFFAQVGDIGQRLTILLDYIDILSNKNQNELIGNYARRVMDIAQEDPYWFSKVLQQLSLLVPSDAQDTSEQPGFGNLPSYLSHAHTYAQHTREVYGVAWSPDDRYIASVSSDHTLQVWSATNGGNALVYQHPQAVRSVAWSPKPAGNSSWYLATACDDGKVYLWMIVPDQPPKKFIARLEGHRDSVRSVAWSPDGNFLASGGDDGRVYIWDIQQSTSKHLHSLRHDHWVNAVAWSPTKDTTNNAYFVASASHDNTVRVWNSTNGERIRTYRGHQKAVYDLIWSPNGITIASASADKTIQVWEYNTGNHGTTYKEHKDAVVSLARSPYGRRIVSSSRNDFHLWYAATGDRILNNSPTVGWIRKVAWSHNGLFIALATGDEHTVQIWRVGGNI